MTKLPFSRLLLSVALASTLGLTGCDVSDSADDKPTSDVGYNGSCLVVDVLTDECLLLAGGPAPEGEGVPDTFVPGTYPRFNPAAADLPLNTDLPFSGSTDGTAATSGSDTVRNAINDVDGWSTNAYFDVALSDEIDPATVNANPLSPGQNVFLLPIESTGDALDPDNINVSAPFSPTNVGLTTYTASVVSLDGGDNNVIRIKPTSPLFAKKKYLVVLTNGVEDIDGNPIRKAPVYDQLASDVQLVSDALLPLRDAVQGWEALAVGYIQARNTQLNTAFSLGLPVDPVELGESVALTFTFTTTDPVTPLVGMGGPRAALFSAIAAAVGAPTAIAALNGADAGGLLSSPKPRTVAFPAPNAGNSFDLNTLSGGALSAGRASLFTGSITLPYYQTVTDGSTLAIPTSPTAVPALNSFWTGDTTLASALSLPLPADSDASYNTTYRYPFAARTANVTVPIQTTLPTGAGCNALYPDDGYPVVIYVHGITSDRASVLALAHALANPCIATVAIDLPMHGIAPSNPLWQYLNVDRANATTVDTDNSSANERHFEIAQIASGPYAGAALAMDFGGTADGSGAWFINLANLQNSRDNLRQAVMDLLNLNATLASIDSDNDGDADFDTDNVSVVGVSLGGMVATTFTTVNQAVLAGEAQLNAATGDSFAVRLNSIKALTASVAGGQLTRILENSLSFGPRILGGLHGAGAIPGTSNYEKFMFVAQTMVDSGDPLNFASTLSTMGVPVLIQEIVGGSNLGDGLYLPDLVVPNNANSPVTQSYEVNEVEFEYTTDTAPLAGTDPLLTLLGITEAASDPGYIDMEFAGAAVSKLSIGYHSSLLTTASGAPTAGNTLATGELQTQVVTFVDTVAGAGLSGAPGALFGTAGANAAAPYTSVMVRNASMPE